MTTGRQPLLVLNQDCSCTVTQLTDHLMTAGYSVVQSFNLFSTLSEYSKCMCQMVILLVYAQEGPPSTLILDGNNFKTFIFLENDPKQSFRTQFLMLLSQLPALNEPFDILSNQDIDIA
ncbi:MAG: hypothetical protein CVU39_07310 [Chloroflexi bacterium HGW-Chloroflexi-10]|nr:MAG: hypothetical protein CVU39_07310 [Chloroflexi bacterium HGW-Chloroflexi-10]